MKYTASHWGAYQITKTDTATQIDIKPLPDDPAPSRIGRGWISAARDRDSRILKPAIRKGWLEGDNGANRCRDSFVEVSWDEAIRHAASELQRVKRTYGNGSVFGGSYGWSSAGRFHHAQSQLRRFLNLAGGFVSSRNTYSHAAAEVIYPHILGLSNRAFQDDMTALPLVTEHCEILLAFGGISGRTAQIASSGTSAHAVPSWLDQLRAKNVRLINVSPQESDLDKSEWWAIRPGTDTALLLALMYEIVVAGRANEDFLKRYTSGWEVLRAYLMGESDGVAKSSDWAATLCDLAAPDIRALALQLVSRKSMIAMTWGMQRADHGEQPLWAGLALACLIGQIGQPGTGYAFGYGSSSPVGQPSRLISWPSMPQGKNPISDYIPVARIADMLLNPGGSYSYNGENRIYPTTRLIWWVGGNPFHHHQDLNRFENAWTRPETVIVNEHSWTATARRADIVLPATTPMERTDIMLSRRDPTLLYMSKLFDPMGEAKDDFEIFKLLSRALGFEQSFTEGLDQEAWLREIWQQSAVVAQQQGFELPSFESFVKEGRFDVPDASECRIALESFVSDPKANPLNTESGRITLFNETIAAMDLSDCPGHPTWLEPCESLLDAEPDQLHLISGQPDTRLHSQNDRGSESRADKINEREPAYLHPETAQRRGLCEGDIVKIANDRGACLAGLRLSKGIRKDCIALATGAWFDPQTINGLPLEVHGNPNVLTIDKGASGLSQGNIAHTALVRVEKWTAPLPDLTISKPPKIKTQPESA
ncbi:molybdopterin-dependent oxidoreductase [Cohaesibacter celericrescens]|uniref:molybdopterin-dependent oxidoreductase n=1 Tax=Cohaesibacter celericrescens TaxID=2067669 RepID=UPI00356B004A